MYLLVAMTKGQTRVVRYKIHRKFLIPSKHHDVSHNACCRHSGDIRQLKGMTLKMNRLDVIALVTLVNAVAVLALMK